MRRVPDYGWEAVSGLAMALFLACVCDLGFMERRTRAGQPGRMRSAVPREGADVRG